MNKDESKNTINILKDKIKITKRILKNDIKISNIFQQINKDSNKDLDKILELSNQRIKCAKKGNNISLHLNKYFDKEIKIKNSLSSKVIYIKSNEINVQKNKFNKSKINIIEKNKEMKTIFDKIRNDINPLKNINKYFTLKNSNKKKYGRYNSTIGKEAIQKISTIINDEKELINNKINSYLKFTKYFEDKNINRLEKKNMIDLKIKNISNSFGFLEYNKRIRNKVNNKNNVIPYIKSKILENLTQTLKSNNNKINSNSGYNSERIDLNNNYKLKDSLCIVKSEISNSDTLKSNYLKKMLRFDELINSTSLPSLDDYSTIISDKRREELLKKKKNKLIKIPNLSERKKINHNIYNEKFYNDMENIYREKNIEINQENELMNNILKMKKNDINDKKNDTIYLTQVHSKKSSNISDLFTSREKEINDNNTINRYLKNNNENYKNYYNIKSQRNNNKNNNIFYNNNNIIRLKKIVY